MYILVSSINNIIEYNNYGNDGEARVAMSCIYKKYKQEKPDDAWKSTSYCKEDDALLCSVDGLEIYSWKIIDTKGYRQEPNEDQKNAVYLLYNANEEGTAKDMVKEFTRMVFGKYFDNWFNYIDEKDNPTHEYEIILYKQIEYDSQLVQGKTYKEAKEVAIKNVIDGNVDELQTLWIGHNEDFYDKFDR